MIFTLFDLGRQRAQGIAVDLSSPHEIGGVVLFLASRAGGFVTGHNLVIDGGTLVPDGS